MVGQVLRTVFYVVGMIVLARILSPDDYGIVALAGAIVAFARLFRDAGLSSVTVQRERITRQQVSTLFWANVAVTASVAVAIVAASPLIAAFFHRAELTAVTALLGLSFFVSTVMAQHEALLRRLMLFGPLAASVALGQLAEVVVAISSALAGLGYWSLVVGSLVGGIVSGLVVFGYCPWLPGRPSRLGEVREELRFGLDIVGFNLVNYAARNGDYLLIGRVFGAGPLGLYTRAYQLFMQPISQVVGPLASVGMPALASLRSDPESYRAYFRRLIGVLSMLAVPIAVYFGVESPFVVSVLLGEGWGQSAPVLRWLTVAGVIQATMSTLGLVLVSTGRSREYFYYGVTNAAAMILAFAIGLRWGITGVAAAYSIANLLYWPPAVYFFTRSTPVRITDFWGALIRPVVYSLFAVITMNITLRATATWTYPLSHAFAAVTFVAAYGTGLLWQDESRSEVRRLLRAFRASDSIE